MKFIRDIIGEKRQMQSETGGFPAAAEGEPRPQEEGQDRVQTAPRPTTTPSRQHTRVEALMFQTPPEADDGHDTPAMDFSLDTDEPENEPLPDMSDDLASELNNLFADDDEDAATDSPAPDGAIGSERPNAEEEESILNALNEAPTDTPLEAEEALDTPATDQAEDAPLQDDVGEPRARAAVTEPRLEQRATTESSLAPASDTPEPAIRQPAAPLPGDTGMAPHRAAPDPIPAAEPASPLAVEVPQPAQGRGAGRHGRAKTRLLGFNAGAAPGIDPLSGNAEASASGHTMYPVGWLVVVDGAGYGAAFTLYNGVSKIGRGADQTVRLDFGDNSISRENHALIAYDAEQKRFYVGHGGKANLVRRNSRPVLSTEELCAGDRITIGETVLRFIPLCGQDFGWGEPQENGWAHAAGI